MRRTRIPAWRPVALGCAALVLAACSSDDGQGATSCTYGGQAYAPDERFPSLDGCNSCACIDGEVRCTLVACACVAMGTCADGPECNGTCCAAGERCSSTGECMCGANPACTAGATCQPAETPSTLGCGYSCVP